jgi:phosphatidate cytidylyltransferase
MKRFLTGLILTPFFFYVVALARPEVFWVCIAAVGVFCLYEFLGILAARFPAYEDLRRNPAPYAGGIVLLALPAHEGLYLTLFALLALALVLRSRDLAASLPQASGLLLGVVYIFGAWRCGVLLRAIDPWWMLFATAINWVGDTFAYYTGRAVGRHKLAPLTSPGKSWEGAAASAVSALVLGWVYIHYRFPAQKWWQALALSLAANVTGQIGDLAESALKRGAGVKDSGNLLPGHGGWLDRVDSSLFSVPVVYWLLNLSWFRS